MPLKEDQVDLSGLYPELGPEELDQARENLHRYLGLIFRIAERQAYEATDNSDYSTEMDKRKTKTKT